ncbi:MAG: ribosome recycling factor [Anaerolineaceae bacterium]|nr:ribosome recycling factor [Anaerolineaceae bacterium]|tara:strand:+ start:20786 stop:21343 length:558 start_codon:yes stop_codon:yes gene_type:complete
MIKELMQDARDRMQASISALEDGLSTIRTGRASPVLVEKLMINYYEQQTPLNQLASISVPEPRMIAIRPFDSSTVSEIERSIMASDLGLTPNNDGKIIRLSIPPLTEERRKEITKVVGQRVEEARVSVRNVRRDTQNDMRDFEREKLISEDELEQGQKELQKLTDQSVEKINALGDSKHDEVMHV